MEFKNGDKVVVIEPPVETEVWLGDDIKRVVGLTGIIINADSNWPLIRFKKLTTGHGANNQNWYVMRRFLRLAEERAERSSLLPAGAKERKKIPIGTGVLDYFPAALAEIAKVSHAGNEQHNPGQPLHWARGKSTDQADTMIRHFLERGTLDSDGVRHSAKMCWRALAILQLELEAEGAPIARGAKE